MHRTLTGFLPEGHSVEAHAKATNRMNKACRVQRRERAIIDDVWSPLCDVAAGGRGSSRAEEERR